MTEARTPAQRCPLEPIDEALAHDGRWAPWPSPVILESVTSTMAEVGERAADGEGVVVVAEEQTAGRGRRGRSWESARHAGIWMSVLLAPRGDPQDAGWLPLVVGTAVARALTDASGIDVRLKWPNDIVVIEDGRTLKVGGILAERRSDGTVIAGVGINVAQDLGELPEGGASLRTLGIDIRRERVLVGVLGTLAQVYRTWQGGADPAPEYREACVTLGQAVRVQQPNVEIIGVALDVAPGGELIVEGDDGIRHVVSAGDVHLVRPIVPR